MKFGPCMDPPGSDSGDESTGSNGGNVAASQSVDQPSNPFASASPELRNCIVQAVGQEVFEQLVGGAQPSQEDGTKFGPCMGAQGSDTPGGGGGPADSGSCIPEDPSGYGRPNRDFLLGIKAFQLQPGNQSVSNAADIKALGMNAVSLSFQIPFDDDGHVRYPFSSFGTSHPTLDSSLCHIGNLVHEMKVAGLSVYLSGEPIYYALKPGVEPTALDADVVATYTQELLEVMEALASTAEIFKVDWLAPISEPDKYFGPDPANEFMQEIRPLFTQFQGKSVWQVFHDDEILNLRLNLSGYDIAGIAALGCDQDGPGGRSDTAIANIINWAQEDQVPEIAHVEFGCIGKAQDIPAALTNLQRWYDTTSAFSTGLIVLDEPAAAPNAQQVVGTWLEDWVTGIAEEHGFK